MQVLHRSRGVIRFGPFELDLGAAELRKHGLKTRLQQQPFRVLALLLEHPGEVVTREELRQAIWPADTFVDFNEGLDATIYKLRNTLGDSSENPRFVETLPRRGYRFIAPVEEIRPKTIRVRNLLTLAGVLTAVVLALLFGLNLAGTRDRLLRKTSNRPIRSLVVLPLQNLSGDPSQEYFVDGMTEALTTDLGKIGALRVISRTSAMQYKGIHKKMSEIAKELNVDAAVEGAVLRSGGRVGSRRSWWKPPATGISGRRPMNATYEMCSFCRTNWRRPSPSKSRSNSLSKNRHGLLPLARLMRKFLRHISKAGNSGTNGPRKA